MLKAGEYKFNLKDNSFEIGDTRYTIHLQDNINGKPNKVLFADRGIGITERVSSLFPIGAGCYSGDAEENYFKLRYSSTIDKHGGKHTWVHIFGVKPIGKRKKTNPHYYFNG